LVNLVRERGLGVINLITTYQNSPTLTKQIRARILTLTLT
jgi:hypothetical protein